jgi:hypothetical protein
MTSHFALFIPPAGARVGARLTLAFALMALLAGPGCGKDSDGGGGAGGSSAGSGGSGAGSGGSGAGSGGSGAGSGGAGGSGGGALASYKTCTREQRVGDFVLTLGDGFTGIERGVVLDGVEPTTQAKLVKMVGGCRLMQPPDAEPPCSSPCSSAQMCKSGSCVAKPVPRNLGKVTITGMKVSPLELENIGNLYTNPPSVQLPVIGFDEGANLVLSAAGGGGVSAFSLRGWGVAPMVTPEAPLPAESGKPVTVTWTPGKMGPAKVLIDFSVNRHGSVDTWLECEADDNGMFVVDGTLTTELFKYGVSGFPSVRLTRQSGDTTTVGGCVQFLVTATADRQLMVPGVISCQDDDVCPAPKKCSMDLTCK